MGYRRTLALRWSRRDRLAVLVIAVTVAFLTGVTLLGLAMGAQTTALAAGFGSPDTVDHYSSPDAARAAAAPDEYVIPTTTLTVDGDARTVVGIPPSVPDVTIRDRTYAFPTGEDGVLAAQTQPRSVERTVDTESGPEQVALAPRPSGQLVSDRWYVTTPATVERLDPTGAFVYSPSGAGSGVVPPGDSVPLLSALAYFILATRQLVNLLVLASLAGGILVAVTAFSVTQVAVEDRRSDIAVIRSTGADPRTVYALFATRALVLTTVGVALGYALGLVLVRGVVNAAVFAGAPTSLTVSVTTRAVELLVPMSLLLVLLGGVAGVLAARPAVRPPPATVARPDGVRAGNGISRILPVSVRRWVRPTVLEWDALVPSTATLTVFVLFVLMIAAAGGVVAPLTAADEQTITQAEAAHPIASSVPASYADTLRQQGIAASPETLLFETARGEPFVARGVDYEAYASLSDPTMVRGRPPQRADEAVIGRDLRQTLGVDVGDELTLGGSTHPAFTRVRVVGVYTGDGIQDDQLLVSLETASRLTGKSEGVVHFIRTDELPTGERTGPPLSVLDASVTTNETRTFVRLRIQNYGLATVDERLRVDLGEETQTVPVRLRSGQQTRVSVVFPPRDPGTYELRVADYTTSVRIGSGSEAGDSSGGLSLRVPREIPTGAQPAVVVTRNGQPVGDVTVTVTDTTGDARTWTTNSQGVARIPFDAAGQYTVEAATGDERARTTVDVAAEFERLYAASLTVSPERPSIATRPQAVATLKNPWSEPVTHTVTLVQNDRMTEREMTLQPGGTARVTLRLPFQPAGAYTVSLRQDGQETTALAYRVQGDERLAAALASSGRQSSGGGIAQAVSIIFGNIRVLIGALVVLVGTMTVGATTASFARSIHAARDEIGIRRAVGASPVGIYRLVFGDVIRIGGVSALLAVGLASGIVWGLLSVGELRLFGVALRPTFSPTLLGATAVCALALALISAAVATVSLVSASPAALLTPVSREAPSQSRDEPVGQSEVEVQADD